MAAMFNHETYKAHAYQSLVDRFDFDKHFKAAVPEKDANVFLNGHSNQEHAGHNYADRAHESASRSLIRGVLFLLFGIVTTLAAIVSDNADFSAISGAVSWIFRRMSC
ncbi:hypothetical protein [Rhizobium sp. CFBP 13726]|uniref:hypothetical protein n=1 Tax=Rhizobium/Agrobacterium group TaxID=227290 RepID=UPI0017801C4C|nr:hypothetical protein [Rhizobium sp. CFBP 13726]MBD8652639.1 hypothetical protein [Rhizobium sp. CFBP 13726]